MAEKTATPSTNDERAQRRARRQALIDAGVQPYPIHSTVTTHAAELEERYAELPDGTDTEDVYSLTGRIRAFRKQGKAAFIVLEDCTAQIQLFCRVNDLPEDEWALLGQLDLGDIIGATGAVLRTRRGQLSIAPTHVELLSKSLRPLPEKFHGLTDTRGSLPPALRRPHHEPRGPRHLPSSAARSSASSAATWRPTATWRSRPP